MGRAITPRRKLPFARATLPPPVTFVEQVIALAGSEAQIRETYVTWLSSTPGVASIGDASGSRGVATAPSTGTVALTAIRSALSGTASLTVQ